MIKILQIKVIYENLIRKLKFKIISNRILYIFKVLDKNNFLRKKILIKEKILGPSINLISASKTNFEFTKKQIQHSEIFIKKNNINNNFIVLHNRDNTYERKFKKILDDTNYHDHRNFDFDVYNKIIKKHNNIDFIRLGKIASKKNNKKKIFMILLIILIMNYFYVINKKCNFAITGTTGFLDIVRLMRKPLLAINFIPLSQKQFFALPKGSIIVPKKIYSFKKSRILKIHEIMDLKDKNIHNDYNYYVKNKLKIIDNSKEDISNAFNEMMNKLSLNYSNNKKIESVSNIKKINQIPFMQLLNKELNINISYSFLQKNPDIL